MSYDIENPAELRGEIMRLEQALRVEQQCHAMERQRAEKAGSYAEDIARVLADVRGVIATGLRHTGEEYILYESGRDALLRMLDAALAKNPAAATPASKAKDGPTPLGDAEGGTRMSEIGTSRTEGQIMRAALLRSAKVVPAIGTIQRDPSRDDCAHCGGSGVGGPELSACIACGGTGTWTGKERHSQGKSLLREAVRPDPAPRPLQATAYENGVPITPQRARDVWPCRCTTCGTPIPPRLSDVEPPRACQKCKSVPSPLEEKKA
jgi:hypothetical protein